MKSNQTVTSKFADKIKIKFHDINLLENALTHRSYLNEHDDTHQSNERLEFLGDAVLQFLSSEFLYKKFPESPEGVLTNLRAALVCTPSLAAASKEIGVGEFLRLSKGEEESGGREKNYILANTFEAILGSIYLDGDTKKCEDFLNAYLFPRLDEIIKSGAFKDYKSKLQEITQEKLSATPVYKELKSWGPDHDKIFVMGVYFNEKLFAQGEGKSKQRAEQEAAKAAIEKL